MGDQLSTNKVNASTIQDTNTSSEMLDYKTIDILKTKAYSHTNFWMFSQKRSPIIIICIFMIVVGVVSILIITLNSNHDSEIVVSEPEQSTTSYLEEVSSNAEEIYAETNDVNAVTVYYDEKINQATEEGDINNFLDAVTSRTRFFITQDDTEYALRIIDETDTSDMTNSEKFIIYSNGVRLSQMLGDDERYQKYFNLYISIPDEDRISYGG